MEPMGDSATMRLKCILTLLCILTTLPILAQEATATPEPEVTQTGIRVESAFVRAAPEPEAEPIASLFENDVIEVIGRNIDGQWFEVRRPNRSYNLGWLSIEVINVDFRPELLPITDRTTGLIGENEVEDTGFSVFVIAESNLRDQPFPTAEMITLVDLNSTLPVLGRDRDSSYFYVNYRGTLGWLSRLIVRVPSNVRDIPIIDLEGVETIQAEIIPIGLQLAQLQAFRASVQQSYDTAISLRDLWDSVDDGLVMPCNVPPFVQEYLYSAADVRELPELDRYAPRFNVATLLINESIDALSVCGAMNERTVAGARADAINAAAIFNNTLGNLDFLEELIIEQGD